MVVRGDLTSREFRAFGLSDSRVLAGMNVTIRDVNDAIQQLVRSGGPVDRGALADRHVPLDQLTTGSRTPFLGAARRRTQVRVGSPATSAPRRSTSRSMAGVRVRVNMLRWLGW